MKRWRDDTKDQTVTVKLDGCACQSTVILSSHKIMDDAAIKI